MRSARANDFWKKVYQQQYANYLESITLSNCMGYSGIIPFKGGITAICGLNGVGKSTIVSCIKSIIGIEDNAIFTSNKSKGVISAEFVSNRVRNTISTPENAVNKGFNSDLFQYIDSNQSIELLKFWSEQTNLDEYLESFEPYTFTSIELEEISWLIGKKYKECISVETEEETKYKQVFFKVISDNQSYSSVSMGLGEHFLLYVYYLLKKTIQRGAYVIIEEPESYISIFSQEKLMDFVAERIANHGISVVITTHSPHILKNIRNANTLIVSNAYGSMRIVTGDSVDPIYYLGVEKRTKPPKIATLFVEDHAARIFLETLLNEEAPALINQVNIISVGGESEITNRISFNDSKYMDYKFIGIYDGDSKNRLNANILKWPYNFLPVKECVEKEISEYISDIENSKKIIENLSLDFGMFCAVISKYAGEDHHDWLLNTCRDVDVHFDNFIKAFYREWKNTNNESIVSFVDFLLSVINDENYSERVPVAAGTR